MFSDIKIILYYPVLSYIIYPILIKTSSTTKNIYFLDCPISTSAIKSDEDDPDYPPSNVLSDECLLDGSKEWRGRISNSQIVIKLGCRQDIKSIWIKNGFKDFQMQNFTIAIATHQKGPWKQVLNESLPPTSTKVT